MCYWSVRLSLSTAKGPAASRLPNVGHLAQWVRHGRSLLLAPELKQAARPIGRHADSPVRSERRPQSQSSSRSPSAKQRVSGRSVRLLLAIGVTAKRVDGDLHWALRSATIAMKPIFESAALMLLFPAFCTAQMLTPGEALGRYLAKSRAWQPGCSGLAFAVEIEASLPKLKKQASMSGLKLIAQKGRIVYSGLRFTGDSLVKNAVIARFLANDAERPGATADSGVTSQNYSFSYDRASDYNGLMAYVYRLRPRSKRLGLLKGELWLDPRLATPLRLWGDLVKSPSIFVRSIRFVQDYQNLDQCVQPLRLLLAVRTRIAGEAEMTVWLHSVERPPATPGEPGSDAVAIQGH
jgi:hypothetical protein